MATGGNSMDGTVAATGDGAPASGERSASYRLVEGAHLRQWLSRLAAPVAIACTNGAGLLEVSWLPRHDAPLAWLGLPPTPAAWLSPIAAALIVAAVWLRVQSKGVLVRRTTLTTGGIYARVRHPFYLAIMLGSVGLLALAGPLGAIAAFLWIALAAPVYSVTVSGEEDGLGTLFPDAWEDYSRQVPRLVPIPGHRAAMAGKDVRITWANLVAEHEPPRLLRYLGSVAAVLGCGLGGGLGTALLGTAAALFALSRVLPGIRPRSRRDAAR